MPPMRIASPRKVLVTGGVLLVVILVLRAVRGRPAPAFAPVAAPPRPWPELKPEPVASAEPTPDWTGPVAAPADADASSATWIEVVDGLCPATHPIKAKMTSGIYHLPGMLNYERARPDRCYRTAADAEADGLRAAKR
jgi:hypothetical protein